MTDLVPAEHIENLVGARRHDTNHYARAASAEQTVHSKQCRDSGIDLRDCPFSVALDRGIEHHIPWSGWRRVQDQAVLVEIFRGYLVPDIQAVRAAEPVDRGDS